MTGFVRIAHRDRCFRLFPVRLKREQECSRSGVGVINAVVPAQCRVDGAQTVELFALFGKPRGECVLTPGADVRPVERREFGLHPLRLRRERDPVGDVARGSVHTVEVSDQPRMLRDHLLLVRLRERPPPGVDLFRRLLVHVRPGGRSERCTCPTGLERLCERTELRIGDLAGDDLAQDSRGVVVDVLGLDDKRSRTDQQVVLRFLPFCPFFARHVHRERVIDFGRWLDHHVGVGCVGAKKRQRRLQFADGDTRLPGQLGRRAQRSRLVVERCGHGSERSPGRGCSFAFPPRSRRDLAQHCVGVDHRCEAAVEFCDQHVECGGVPVVDVGEIHDYAILYSRSPVEDCSKVPAARLSTDSYDAAAPARPVASPSSAPNISPARRSSVVT